MSRRKDGRNSSDSQRKPAKGDNLIYENLAEIYRFLYFQIENGKIFQGGTFLFYQDVVFVLSNLQQTFVVISSCHQGMSYHVIPRMSFDSTLFQRIAST